MLRFSEPIYLWLLILLPLVWLGAARLRLISPGRRYTIIALRTLLILSIVLGLAKAEFHRISKDLAVFYLLDRSESIPPLEQQDQIRLLNDLSKKGEYKDYTGVIAFGKEPSIETSPVQRFDFEGNLLSQISGDRTDIASAVRLAMAAFPTDTMRRIVLMSDGNENTGSLLDIARIAKNSGIPIDVIPMRYDAQNDIQLDKIVVPQRTSKDAPFNIKVFLHAEKETTGILRLFEDGNLITEDRVKVQAGRNPPLSIKRRLKEGGFHNYSATIEAVGDTRPQNNIGNAFTFLKAEPKVLIIEGSELKDAQYLAGAMKAENINADIGTPSDIPVNLEDLQRYDALILSNVAADRMSTAQMKMIERAVHDLGIGLVMIGGEDSFGAGGYMDTPIEKALPVDMDVKQKKMLPNGALVIVLHTCEIPDGNAWAREISIASLNVLSSQDYFGLIFYGYGGNQVSGGWGENWLWNPAVQQVGDKKAMRTKIKGAQPGDVQQYDGLLKSAAQELARVKAQTKHIIVISDGDPSPPSARTVKAIQAQGITVSGVAISPHSPSDVNTLKQMAIWGSGNFYYPKTSKELPRIFTKEATVVRKSLIREQAFSPKFGSPSEVLQGFVGFPQLNGYVITSRKDMATEALTTEWDDPLLAHWRYGLGKSIAFTSDAKNKWGSEWVSWGSYSKFWSQNIRWALRETNPNDFDVQTEISGGQGKVTIDAIDESGNFKNFIDFDTTVIGPNFEPVKISVNQVAPGRYEGTFPADKVGTYMLSMIAADDKSTDSDPQFLTSGAALPYSPEYETSSSADEFLKRVAEVSGGKYIDGLSEAKNYRPYTRDLKPVKRPTPIWPWFLLLGTMILPMDIFLRRVYLDWKTVWGWVTTRLLGFFPKKESKEAYSSRMDNLRAAKSRASQSKEEEKEDKAAREAFRERLKSKTSGQQSENVFEQPKTETKSSVRQKKQTMSAESPGSASKDSGLSALMAAKKRAQYRRKK
jgi:uncharacterized membrane protein